MNYVEMVDRLRIESASSGGKITTLTGLRDEAQRLALWIKNAWIELQFSRDDWYFRQESSAHVLAVGSNVLNSGEFQAGKVSKWHAGSVKLSEPGTGIAQSTDLSCMPWPAFNAMYGKDIVKTGQPSMCSVRPNDNALIMHPAADKAYPVYYDYVRAPQILVADDDVPIIPAEYHMLIVYRALLDYAYYEVAPEALERARKKKISYTHAFERTQLPEVTIGGL